MAALKKVDVMSDVRDTPGRRIKDKLEPKDPKRKLNFDRRVPGRDRRMSTDNHYRGIARRQQVDRRKNLKDRRDRSDDS